MREDGQTEQMMTSSKWGRGVGGLLNLFDAL